MNKTITMIICLSAFSLNVFAAQKKSQPLERIALSEDGRSFVTKQSNRDFVVWGFNYDHALEGKLIEDYWIDNWDAVELHFSKMKALGANSVRIHLQFGKFMDSPTNPNPESLARLAMLVRLAEKTGLYLNLTGLGCYHKQDVPQWYDQMNEKQRWAAQAVFWGAVSKTCAGSNALFCYDLMNEPVFAGNEKQGNEWLAGEPLGGKYFVQRITRDNADRSREEIAKLWVDNLVNAVREHDNDTLITVGVIPWVFVFGGGKPTFYSPDVSENLDFVSVHFYPKSGAVDKALKAIKAYDIGKPIVVEEMFPLHCSIDELEEFIDGSKEIVNGWFGFFWGNDIDDLALIEKGRTDKEYTISMAITKKWLEYFLQKSNEIHTVTDKKD